MKIISPQEAANLIKDGDTIFTASFGMNAYPEEFVINLENRFKETGNPKNLTVYNAAAGGNFGDKGIAHFANEGLLKRVVSGHFGAAGPSLQKLIMENKVEAYNLPQGVIAQMPRYIAGKKPALITKVGLGTFIDPRLEGGKSNEVTKEDIVDLITIYGEEYMLYKLPKVDVAVIRGTYADERGNISLAEESILTDPISVATAAKTCGGIVIAEVKAIAMSGSLKPKDVKVPGIMVDYVIVAKPENHRQTSGSVYNPAFSGDLKVPMHSVKSMPLSERKIIARRAAMELVPNAIVNVGVGIPDGVPTVANEEKVSQELNISTEAGVLGGVPGQGLDFGSSYNPEAIIEHPQQFDFYDGGGIDVTFLGLGESDFSGNVNVSKLGGKPVGVGGFVNITQNAKKVVFCGAFTAGGLKEEIRDGKLVILQEGKSKKFKNTITQVSFSGNYASKNNQPVLYVTERAVFQLADGKLRLIEIAPGMDLEKDILAQMEFTPEIAEDLKTMDVNMFQETWGGLKDYIYKHL